MSEYEILAQDFLEYSKSKGLDHGFRIEKIQYTGFYSQGDGASWLGKIYLDDWLELHPEVISKEEIKKIKALIDNSHVDNRIDVVRITQGCSHFSYHEKTMYLDIDTCEPADDELFTEGEFKGFPAIQVFKDVEKTLETIQSKILEECRTYAIDIHKELETIYWEYGDEEEF